MVKLNLNANGHEQEKILNYLQENASEVLADKINNGVKIEKDGKTLINKKDLDGFMKYACEEARKQAAKGATYACIDDPVVFGWAIHYFEEDSIEGTLYNEDGTEYKVVAQKTTSKPKQQITNIKQIVKPQNTQSSIFELMLEENVDDEHDDEDFEESPGDDEDENYLEENPKNLQKTEMTALKVDEDTGEIIERIASGENGITEMLSDMFGKCLEVK